MIKSKTGLALIVALSLIGCSNTGEGIKEDVQAGSKNASEAARDVGQSASEQSRDLSAATMLTPKIKTAITADKLLNDSMNRIDVDSTSEEIILSGYVTSTTLKILASEITQQVLNENNAKQKIINNLSVRS